MNNQQIDAARFRKALSTYPSGVCVITGVGAEGQLLGLTVGSFTSVSLDPPLVGFLPQKRSVTWAEIAASGRFCVNVLAADQQEISGRMAVPGPDKFDGVDYSLSPAGLPVIADAITWIDCEIHSQVEAGDHLFVAGLVRDMDAVHEKNPLIFHGGKYRQLAETA